jgi:hypothetical protein
MRKSIAIIGLLAATAIAGWASTVTGVSTDATQTNYTVTYSGFNVVGGTPTGTNVGMVGMQITAFFGDGTSALCTWVNATGCTGTGFTVNFPTGVGTDPDAGGGSSATWTVTNTRTNATGHQMTSMFINGIPGNIGFDRCMTGVGTFSDATNSGGNCSTGSGGIQGTTGSNIGWSFATATGGSAGITATGQYANELKIAAQAFQGDAWGSLRITFGGTAFQGGNSTFTFQADTDALASAVGIVPEPATYGLIGLGLAGLGALRFRKRTS